MQPAPKYCLFRFRNEGNKEWISPRKACVHFVTKFCQKCPLLENMFPKTILGCLGRLRWKESIGRWQKGQNCQYRSRRMQNMSQKIVKIKTMRKKKNCHWSWIIQWSLFFLKNQIFSSFHGNIVLRSWKIEISRGEVSKPNSESHLFTEGCCE